MDDRPVRVAAAVAPLAFLVGGKGGGVRRGALPLAPRFVVAVAIAVLSALLVFCYREPLSFSTMMDEKN